MLTAAGQCKSLDSESEVAAEKVFYIDTAAPRMITSQEAIILTEDAEIIGDLNMGSLAISLSKGVGAPDIHVPFAIGIPFCTRWRYRGCFLHFLAGILLRPGQANRTQRAKYYQG